MEESLLVCGSTSAEKKIDGSPKFNRLVDQIICKELWKRLCMNRHSVTKVGMELLGQLKNKTQNDIVEALKCMSLPG